MMSQLYGKKRSLAGIPEFLARARTVIVMLCSLQQDKLVEDHTPTPRNQQTCLCITVETEYRRTEAETKRRVKECLSLFLI